MQDDGADDIKEAPKPEEAAQQWGDSAGVLPDSLLNFVLPGIFSGFI